MGFLRLLLATSVVIAHCGSLFNLEFVGGQIAVQSFFIISGFYMSLILNEKYTSNGSYLLFITNRALRLYPIYWVVLLLTVLTCFLHGQTQNNGSYLRLDNFLNFDLNISSFLFLIFTNAFLIFQDIVLFLGLDASTGNLFLTSNFSLTSPQLHSFLFVPQGWSLGIEIAFYLIAPFILRKKLFISVFILVISLLLKVIIIYSMDLNYDPWTYRFFPTELMFFLMGNISYYIYNKVKDKSINKIYSISLFVYLCLFTIYYFKIPTFGYSSIIKTIFFFISMMMVIPFLFKFFKDNTIDRYIGELSYPIYISHIMVSIWFSIFGISLNESTIYLIISTLIISAILNHFVAGPIERIRQARIK